VPPFPLFPFVAVVQRHHSPSLSCLPPPPLSCLTSRILVQHVWPRIKSAFCLPARLTENQTKPVRLPGHAIALPQELLHPCILGFLASWSVSLHAFSGSWHHGSWPPGFAFSFAIVLDSLSALSPQELLHPFHSTRSQILGIVPSQSCIFLLLLFSIPSPQELLCPFPSMHSWIPLAIVLDSLATRVITSVSLCAFQIVGIVASLCQSKRHTMMLECVPLIVPPSSPLPLRPPQARLPLPSHRSHVPLQRASFREVLLSSCQLFLFNLYSKSFVLLVSRLLLHVFLDSITTTYVTKPKSFTLCNIQFTTTINNHTGGDLGPYICHQLGIGQIVRVECKTSVTVMVALGYHAILERSQ